MTIQAISLKTLLNHNFIINGSDLKCMLYFFATSNVKNVVNHTSPKNALLPISAKISLSGRWLFLDEK